VRTWGDLGSRLLDETKQSPDVVRHLIQQLVGLLNHLNLMPLQVLSRLSQALEAHRKWADANPTTPAVTRTRLRSLARLAEMPYTEPLRNLLLQMELVLVRARDLGVTSHSLDSGPTMGEPWIGFNINAMAYFFFVPLHHPENIVLQRYGRGVDPKSFVEGASIGEIELRRPDQPARWRHTLDLSVERFFDVSEVQQFKIIEAFFARAFAFGETLSPTATEDAARKPPQLPPVGKWTGCRNAAE